MEAQWVNPNDDGTYTSPGEGWNEFIPTESRPSLWLYTNNGNLVTLLGENADGSPRSPTLSTGRVEDASLDIVGLFIPGKLGIKGLIAGASALWAKHLAKKVAKEAAEEVVEIVARDGTKITGLTKHGVNRVIGDAGKRAGTKPEAILDALKNPTKIKEGIDNLGRPYTRFTRCKRARRS